MADSNSVLIIEQNEDDRNNIIEVLSSEYKVIEVSSSINAIDVIEEKLDIITVIILDITDNTFDGYDLLCEMKRRGYLVKIPVIVTSGEGDEELELRALSMGASDFLRKPYNSLIVQKRIGNIMKNRENATMVDHLEKDYLTGVYSEEVFCRRVVQLMEKNPEQSYAIVYSDMENYQLLKDLFGETVSNNILVYMAKVFKHLIDRNEICGRLEGDHFVLFVKYDEGKLQENLESVVKIINEFPVNMNIRLRFGIYEITDRTMPVSAMCNRAMITVNNIKGKYGQCVAFYDNDIWEKQLREQEIIDCMETALKEKQFEVYFQPKYDLSSEKIAGAEALVRWHHPTKGFMNPGEFIPLFEKNGFITELDKYVWDSTCKYISTWKKNGYPIVPVSVNVSRTDIYNPELVDIILGMIHKYDLLPENIHLEITETAYTDNPQQIIDVVKKLKMIGFVIEMDDFGSGYSSLNMLNELPIDILKLDMGFVQGDFSSNSNNILSFIISLAKWMDYAVVAEGIETEAQIQMLRNMDCNYVQGYYYAKPMPPDEFEAYMLKHNVLQEDPDSFASDLNQMKFQKSQGVMLIVDDLSLNRKILSASFNQYFKIVEKENGAEALDYIKDNYKNIDVIMLDLVMPVMDGFSLMNKLRMDEKYRNIPIIVTSQGGEKSVEKSFDLGATDFVEKPYNLRIILHRVQNAVMAFRNAKKIRESVDKKNVLV